MLRFKKIISILFFCYVSMFCSFGIYEVKLLYHHRADDLQIHWMVNSPSDVFHFDGYISNNRIEKLFQ
jgi:hypothetical protein